MDDGQFDALTGAVSAASDNLARPRLAAAVAEALAWDEPDAGILVDALLGAHSVHQRRKASASAVADNIAQESALKLADDEQPVLAARLTRLLGVEPLSILSRAAQLLAEDEQTYCGAQSLSDLRPVFRVGPEPPEAVGVLIRHTLHIRYHADGPDAKGFFLTVDEAALRDLRAVIDRALAKSEALRKLASASGMRIVDVEESH